MFKNKFWLVPSLAVVLLVCGCGQKHLETTEVPKEPEANEPIAQKPQVKSSEHYRVAKNDCLWSISAKSSIYGDAFEWPMIFKSNRDLIKDPDLIYTDQVFLIDKEGTPAEMQHAKKNAEETPKYVSHSQPNTKLGVDYF